MSDENDDDCAGGVLSDDYNHDNALPSSAYPLNQISNDEQPGADAAHHALNLNRQEVRGLVLFFLRLM